MSHSGRCSRRRFLAGAAAGGAAIVTAWPLLAADEQSKHAVITPVEDLLFEHAALNRIGLVYLACAARLEAQQDVSGQLIAGMAQLVRRMVENYHAKTEEEYVFPRFEKGPHAELVKTLKTQHQASMKITDAVMAATKGESVSDPRRLADLLRQFVLMDSPHIAREGSVLFRAFQAMVPVDEYRRLGETFEQREEKALGPDGFAKALDQISRAERELKIHDLDQFTPKA